MNKRLEEIHNMKKLKKFLFSSPWSSYIDYDGCNSIFDYLKALSKKLNRATDSKHPFNNALSAINNFQDNILINIPSFNHGSSNMYHDLNADEVTNIIYNAFGSQVCASTIMDKPVVLTTDFAKEILKDRISYSKGKDLKLFKKLLNEANHNNNTWFKFPNSYNNPDKVIDTKGIVNYLEKHFIKPLLGKTRYKPKNVKKAIQMYKNHKDTNATNYDITEEISISDQLDNIQDRIGLMSGVEAIITIDRFCFQMLKQGKYNYVVNPNDLIPSYI